MSCGCCILSSGRNIVLEVVTIVIAGILLLPQLFVGSNNNSAFFIGCNIGAIIACSFGIASLQDERNYRLGWVTVVLGVVVFIPFVILLIVAFITLPTFVLLIQHIKDDERNTDEQRQAISFGRGIIILSVIFMFAYVAFGLGTSLALFIKHLKISRERRQQRLTPVTNDGAIVMTTVMYTSPSNQAPAPAPTGYYPNISAPSQQQQTTIGYHPGMGPPQQQPAQQSYYTSMMPPQQQPPPYCEKNQKDMV